MSNAVKYSYSNDQITVEVKATKIYGEGVFGYEISVTDQGVGLNDLDREHIFEPFFKSKSVENETRNPDANGIGLSICKRIANAMDCDLLLCPTYR